jgi:aspartyl-tRNA(Asn)/glutamyl-tRNA(Gln) amidotransferase subunit A
MYKESALSIRNRFVRGEQSAQSIASYFLKRIKQNDDKVDAFLAVLSERAMKKAEELDKKRKEGKALGKMAGIPVAIKDNLHIKGHLTTCASRFLANYKAVFDATIVRLLEEEDAILIGKTNMDEFAMGSSTENSAFKKTKNPWDLSCTPGGSSGGSAAAVAARLCPLSLGSDTGGSIRQPAALSGVIGFKPTYGRVSRYGLVAFASSLDQIGPFSTTIEDTALIMETIGRHCDRDSTSIQSPSQPYLEQIKPAIQGKTIGVPWHFLEQLAPEAKANFDSALEVFRQLGVSIVEVDLNILKYSLAVYYILATAEASTNLARYDGIRYGLRSSRAATLDEVYDFSKQEGFGPEVKNRILLGTYVLSSGYKDAYYKKAQQVRTLIIQKFKEAFGRCDMIAMPCSPFPAFPLGSIQDPLQMYLQDIYTISANLAGTPAISIPSGFSSDRKPFGFQLIGPQMHDGAVMQFAHHFEKATNYTTQIPSLFDNEVSL